MLKYKGICAKLSRKLSDFAHFVQNDKNRYKRGKPSPRSQAKSLHESPLQAVPILSALLACPLPLRPGAQPLKPDSSQVGLIATSNG